MARYFGGNSMASFFRTTTLMREITTAGRFDSAYVANAMELANGTLTSDYIETAAFSATGTVWIAWDIYSGTFTASVIALTVVNGTTNVFRLDRATSTTWQAQYWDGSAWTNTGSAFLIPATSTVTRVAIKLVLNTSFEAYVGGTLQASGSGWSGSSTTVTACRFGGGNTTHAISQVMVADYDLRDSKLMAALLNGDSATNTSGTGAYTTINETVLNDSNGVNITASGGKRGQTKAAITVPSGYKISAMVIGSRGRVSGTITNGKLGIRSSGTNYSSSNLNYAAGYEPRIYISDTDPATATDFTQTGFNNAEIYEEAV
jgi:hypothetical protein